MECDFGQMLTAVVTPFDSSLAVNYDQFRKLLNYLVKEDQMELWFPNH